MEKFADEQNYYYFCQSFQMDIHDKEIYFYFYIRSYADSALWRAEDDFGHSHH